MEEVKQRKSGRTNPKVECMKNEEIALLELVSWSELQREECGQNRMNETEEGKEELWSLVITRSSIRSA